MSGICESLLLPWWRNMWQHWGNCQQGSGTAVTPGSCAASCGDVFTLVTWPQALLKVGTRNRSLQILLKLLLEAANTNIIMQSQTFLYCLTWLSRLSKYWHYSQKGTCSAYLIWLLPSPQPSLTFFLNGILRARKSHKMVSPPPTSNIYEEQS